MSTPNSSTPSSDRWPAPSPYYFDYPFQHPPRFYNASSLFDTIYNVQVEAPVYSQFPVYYDYAMPATEANTFWPSADTAAWPPVNPATWPFVDTAVCPPDNTAFWPSANPTTTVRPTVASPRPVYAYNFLQDIENALAIERFEGFSSNADITYPTTNIQAPAWKLPCPDTLDGVPGHVGIVEHGPRLDGYRDCYTPPGLTYSDFTTYPDTSSAPSAHTYTTTENFYEEPAVAPELANGMYGWHKSAL